MYVPYERTWNNFPIYNAEFLIQIGLLVVFFTKHYNPQIRVYSDNQIIVAQHINQKANDKQEVKPALEQIKATTEKLPEKMSLDNGYESENNLDVLERENIEAYVALNKGEKASKDALDTSNRRLVKADFSYDKEKDVFICPAEQVLPLIQSKKDGRKIYQEKIPFVLNAPIMHDTVNPKRICTNDQQ